MGKSEVYMLCGPAGSGKTTYAESLVAAGALKLSIDEGMAQYGRVGEDYAPVEYPALEQEVLRKNRETLVGALAVGRTVVLDYGFGRREERDEYKKLIEENGGVWRLVYFAVSRDELRRRLRIRNQQSGPNAMPVSDQLLDDMLDWFEVPEGEGEEVIVAS